MLYGFIILIAFQLAGAFISEVFALSIPGSVIGMLLLLVALFIRGQFLDEVGSAADGLIKYIGLLFVPAGAGISLYLGLIAENWLIIICASLGSTVLTLSSTALIFKALSRSGDKGGSA